MLKCINFRFVLRGWMIMAEKTAKKHEIDMTEGKLFPKIFAFAMPLILTSVLQLLFNSADMIVVGKFVNNDAVGAVGSPVLLTLFSPISQSDCLSAQA